LRNASPAKPVPACHFNTSGAGSKQQFMRRKAYLAEHRRARRSGRRRQAGIRLVALPGLVGISNEFLIADSGRPDDVAAGRRTYPIRSRNRLVDFA